ncbi:hypothetical protein PC110_g576 [Phytophthora cactorum]|uniref:Tf2-1-like SH3-like domain-containing protein n=3 Tax=Phytophthora cactorum TaxID=29920 RepID=A0A329T3M7_9STRA|nr:hypothetical protein PC110_g576 [Phytophthora cactorum]
MLRQEVFLKSAQDAMSEAQERMKGYYDKNRNYQEFEVGQLVLLDGTNLDIRHKGFAKSFKLAPRLVGPYPIVEKVQNDSYKLAMSDNLKIHPVFHTSLLKAYQKDEQRRQKARSFYWLTGKPKDNSSKQLSVIVNVMERNSTRYIGLVNPSQKQRGSP